MTGRPGSRSDPPGGAAGAGDGSRGPESDRRARRAHPGHELGRRGEAWVVRRLTRDGWRIVETNWRGARGEIDIVAEDGPFLVFIEVRTRRGEAVASPEDSVGPRKRARLARLAEEYLVRSGWTGPARIDVVALVVDEDDRVVRHAHYRGAVSADWA